MHKEWVKVFSTDNDFNADLVGSLLKSSEINFVKLNKKDSSYNAFGSIEVYVHKDNFGAAIEMINKSDL